jgi:hypothetical protein
MPSCGGLRTMFCRECPPWPFGHNFVSSGIPKCARRHVILITNRYILLPPVVYHSHQTVEQLERDGRYDEPIRRSDATNVIAQKSLPTLGQCPAAPDRDKKARALDERIGEIAQHERRCVDRAISQTSDAIGRIGIDNETLAEYRVRIATGEREQPMAINQ